MATDSLDRVRLVQQDVLDEGEYYTAAARVRWKSGALRFLGPLAWLPLMARRRGAGEVKLPLEAVWATTDRRFLVFNADRLRRVKPTSLVISFPLGEQAYLLSVADSEEALAAGGTWTYLSVSLGGERIDVEAPEAEAKALAHALRGYGPRRERAPAIDP